MKIRKFVALCLGACLPMPSLALRAQEGESEIAKNSQLAGVPLSGIVIRLKGNDVPPVFNDALKALLAAAGPNFKQGQSEVLAWSGPAYKKANAPQIKQQIMQNLQGAGWQYEEGETVKQDGQEVSTVSIVRADPRRAVMGFWAPSDESLVLAWTEILAKDAPVQAPPTIPATAPQNTAPPAHSSTPATGNVATVLNVGAGARYVNVMKNATPKIPEFPALTPKSGVVRGYVKDLNGKPLKNAKFGVRSTAIGGAYSGSKGQSDDKGYYEFAVPFGVAHFYAGAYTVDWGEGRAALSLHPADGELDSFASNVGGVENFVLLPYGIANRDKASESPQNSGNYYGGACTIGYSIGDGGITSGPGDLPSNSQVEITFTPEGALFDGSAGRAFTLHKQIEAGGYNYFYVNNLPLGTYRVSATLDGAPLNLKETGPYAGQPFGLEPKSGRGSAVLTFRPAGAQADQTLPAYGNWNSISITLSR